MGIRRQSLLILLLCASNASAAFISVQSPPYTPGVGGFLGGDVAAVPGGPGINDSGTAVGYAHRYNSSGTDLGGRAVQWNGSGTAIELGNLGTDTSGFSLTATYAINSAGTTAGFADKYDASGASKGRRAVRWDASGTAATELGHLGTDPGGVAFATAYAINTAGTAAGNAAKYDGAGVWKGSRAVRWNSSGAAVTELGTLGTADNGITFANAIAINDAGTAAGYAEKADGMGQGMRAIRWDAAGTAATELGNLGTDSSGYTNAYAQAINTAGTVVGVAHKGVSAGINQGERAVRWDASGTAATELGDLGTNTFGYTAVSAWAINTAGTAAGYAEKYDGGVYRGNRAVRWDASGTAATELGNLGTGIDGVTDARAFAINNANVAVGYLAKYDAEGNYFGERAVYWGTDNLPIDLNTLIDPASGWTLQQAKSISNTGWIAGTGLFDSDGPGGQVAYRRLFSMQVLATAVPEPSATALLGLAAIALRRIRRCA